MSNIIPMVSASPPPMDEGGGFDWDDDDDFGTFTSASDNSFAPSEPAASQDSPFKSMQVPYGNDIADFANFKSHSENEPQESLSKQCSKNLSNEHRPECIHLAQESAEHEEQVLTNCESNCYQNANGPLVDSGVYSSNVSPVQHVESSGSEKVQVHNSEDNNKPTRDETTNELPSNLKDEFKTVVEEPNEPFKETLNSESSVQKDASSSVTQEKDKVSDESENLVQTDSLKESIQCIPPTNIPEADHVLESGTKETEEENFMSHENSDESIHVVISNCDESHNNNSDILNENSNSVSSVDSQKSGHSQIVCQTDNAEESCDAGVEIDNDLAAESSSDLRDFSSVDQSECNVEEAAHSVKRIEQESDIASDVVDSNKLADQESKTQESSELYDSSSKEKEESLQKQTVSTTETNGSPENEKAENINTCIKGDEFEEEMKDTNDQYESVKTKQNETNLFDNHSESNDNIEDVIKSTETSDTENVCVSNAISDSKDSEMKSDEIEAKNECTLDENSRIVNSDDDTKTHSQENSVPVNDTSNTSFGDNQNLGDTTATVDKENPVEDDGGDFGDFSTTDFNNGDDFGDFNASLDEKQAAVSAVTDVADDDDFGDFNSNFEKEQAVSDSVGTETIEDFGDFNASVDENENKEQSGEGFGDFSATFDNVPTSVEQTSNDWAAFSEPQIAAVDNEGDEWAGFEEEESDDITSSDKMETEKVPVPDLANMSKHEKLLYAVTTCFPALVSDFEVCDLEPSDLNEIHIDSDSKVWGHVKGQNTTDALSYQWTKSLWNAQLFSTLHIDTRNILIGHKKAPVPVFAAGLTLLEPTKGQAPLKPDILVDTSKSESSHTSQSQESIPAAQFDWSSSGLTNPLEANNKTLNLDFLIQDQATKSNALESEFLSTNDSPIHKPAIQPLENILANLKTTSTFKPTNQNEDISQEASKVVQSLPDLVFMKSKVLMFPVKFGGFEK